MCSAGGHDDSVLKDWHQERLYLLLLFRREALVQQPQTLLEGGGSLKPESAVI